jgi:hypothetical protein
MKPASRIEALVDFVPMDSPLGLTQFDSWGLAGDFAMITFSKTTDFSEVLDYQLVLNDELEIECIGVSAESKNVQSGQVVRSGYEDFSEPIRLEDVSFHGRYIKSEFLKAMNAHLSKINALSELVTGANWEVKRGQVGSDVQYAVTAALFVALQKYSSQSVLNRCAEILGIPYEGAKTRLRTARSRGLLTMPGMGSTSSELTKKAKDILKKESISEY